MKDDVALKELKQSYSILTRCVKELGRRLKAASPSQHRRAMMEEIASIDQMTAEIRDALSSLSEEPDAD